MRPKVIFIDKVHPILFERLEQAGYQCEWKYELNRDDILATLHDYYGVVIRSKFNFDQEVFDKAIHLKWIARSGSGMENIDLKAAKKRGVKCINSPEGNQDAVAEHCIAMLLSLFNQLNQANQEVKRGEWNREQNRGIELKGKTVGLLGYGHMGKALSERLAGFGVRTVAYDKYKSNYGSDLVEELELDQFFYETEILSIHLPLTDETKGMIDQHFIDQFHHNLYLINSARGKNVVTDALVASLESGKVKGACLDVLEFEDHSFERLKPSTSESMQYLMKSDKVLLSPHIAGWTEESYYKLSSILADKILSEISV